MIDAARKRRDVTVAEVDEEHTPDDSEFDRVWALQLATRAMRRLGEEGSPYYQVLVDHLEGKSPSRNKLWIARKKLTALVRDEVAFTCRTPEEVESELARLAPYLKTR